MEWWLVAGGAYVAGYFPAVWVLVSPAKRGVDEWGNAITRTDEDEVGDAMGWALAWPLSAAVLLVFGAFWLTLVGPYRLARRVGLRSIERQRMKAEGDGAVG